MEAVKKPTAIENQLSQLKMYAEENVFASMSILPARQDENTIVELLHVVNYCVIMAKREGGAPGNDPKQHDRQRNMQMDRHGGIDHRKAYEQNNDRNDKPHVIGFPYRTNSLIHGAPGLTPVGP